MFIRPAGYAAIIIHPNGRPSEWRVSAGLYAKLRHATFAALDRTGDLWYNAFGARVGPAIAHPSGCEESPSSIEHDAG
jgi:hypothetical protein